MEFLEFQIPTWKVAAAVGVVVLIAVIVSTINAVATANAIAQKKPRWEKMWYCNGCNYAWFEVDAGMCNNCGHTFHKRQPCYWDGTKWWSRSAWLRTNPEYLPDKKKHWENDFKETKDDGA